MPYKILFVDHDDLVLQALRRLLHKFRNEWSMSFALSAEDALAHLEREPQDAVITDLRLPHMDGVDLLRHVKETCPSAVRIVLSGQADRAAILRSADHVHDFLAKPCDAMQLKAAVDRVLAVRHSLNSPAIARLVDHIDSMPAIPSIYYALISELRSPNTTSKRVADIISRDIGITTKILRTVNSVAFGLPRQVATISQAVTLLGLEMVKELVLSVELFSQTDTSRIRAFALDSLFDHGLRVGNMARQVMLDLRGDPLHVDHAFTAGLLSDLGILLLASKLPDDFQCVVNERASKSWSLAQTERQRFGATHAEAGAYVLALWGLPNSIVEALAYHHEPSRAGAHALSPLTAVHIASALCAPHFTGDSPEEDLDLVYLEKFRVDEWLPAWRTQARALE